MHTKCFNNYDFLRGIWRESELRGDISACQSVDHRTAAAAERSNHVGGRYPSTSQEPSNKRRQTAGTAINAVCIRHTRVFVGRGVDTIRRRLST